MKLIIAVPEFNTSSVSFKNSYMDQGQIAKANKTDPDDYNFANLRKLLETNTYTKAIIGLNGDPMSYNAKTEFWISCIVDILKQYGVKSSLHTENYPNRCFSFDNLDEVIAVLPTWYQTIGFYGDNLRMFNTANEKIRVLVPELNEKSVKVFDDFRGRISILEKGKHSVKVKLPENARFISPKEEDYTVYFPDGDVQELILNS